MRTARAVAGLALLAACDRPAPGPLAVESVALTAPELDQPAFEPSIAIDRGDPGRIVVGAHYGVGYNRGGRKVWSWQTADGGHTWTGAEIPLPRANASLAADVVTAFGTDRSPVIGFLFADSAFRGGLAIARGSSTTEGFGPARLVVPDRMDRGEGAVDKPWLAVDRGATSPLRGTLYLSWHLNRPLPDRTVGTTLWLGSSKDGANWAEPVQVSTEFGGQAAVRSDGGVDVVYGARDERALQHRSSSDGGRSFGEVDTVARVAPPLTIDLPAVAAAPNGRLALCWTVDSADVPTARRVVCSAGSETAGWSRPAPLDSVEVTSLPAVAAGATDVWALAYRSDSTETAVVLYRSADGGVTYRPVRVLATRPFGIARTCLAPGGSCRKAPPEAGLFFPGDYVGLDVSSERVVAAYVLPETDQPTGRPTVFVSVVRPELLR
jgi:hypothetical protein